MRCWQRSRPAVAGGTCRPGSFHTDHGRQYTAGEFRAACRTLGITQSVGTVGDSYDNAMAESLFAGFKREVIDGEHFATRANARQEIFTWLNRYNQTGSTARSVTASRPNTNNTLNSRHS